MSHTREEHDNLMAEAIEAHNPDYVVWRNTCAC